jgi:calcineurin-like phosphoesterase family protein
LGYALIVAKRGIKSCALLGQKEKGQLEKGEEMVYFTADLHLGHFNVIRMCERPFGSVEEMDNALIANWNQVVTSNDQVYVLGDFSMKPSDVVSGYLKRLNGTKFLVRGNHDRVSDELLASKAWKWVEHYHELKHEGEKFVLFHYPMWSWKGSWRGAIHLYGHVHNKGQAYEALSEGRGFSFNVGVDVNNFYPVSIVKLIELSKLHKEKMELRLDQEEEEL